MDVATSIYWSLQILVWIGLAVGIGFWCVWIYQSVTHKEWRELIRRRDSGEPFWFWSDFLIMFGAFIVAMILITVQLQPTPVSKRPTFKTAGETKFEANIESAPDDSGESESIEPELRNKTDVESESEATGPSKMAASDETPDPGQPDVESDEAKLAQLQRTITAHTLSNASALVVAVLWLLLVYRRPVRDFGWQVTLADFKLALVSSIWILTPVLLISMLVSLLVPYRHVLLDTMATDQSWNSFVMLFVSAVIVTPIAEEMMFRMLLQGGLHHAIFKKDSIEHAGSKVLAWVPIVVASAIFSCMHLGQGAAPIPLFIFSLALGYMYRQTGRLMIPIVIHMVLNGTTLCVEFSRVTAGV